jgi:intein/homing endonuclease
MEKLPTLYQEFIHVSRYARWIEEERRRETWQETVNRYFEFFVEHLKEKHDYTLEGDELDELVSFIYELKTMPSMRALMTAGEALKRDNVAGFNCAFAPAEKLRVFDETLYILMCGTGDGFSVERAYVDKLPSVAEEFFESDSVIAVPDSKIGWCKSLRELISLLVVGQVPKIDYSKIRPAGSRLKTFGGRASGPEVLKGLFDYTIRLFQGASGRKLTTLEVHDLICKIADIVVSGGVRRCRPAGTKVHTKRGLVPIKDVLIGDEVLSINDQYQRVMAKECVGKKNTVVIRTNAGDIVATPEHRFAVFSNVDSREFVWKEAGELTTEDRLIFNTNAIEGTDTEVPDFKYERPAHSTTCKDINVLSLNTSEWAWLIGFLHGDGCVHSDLKSVTFAVSADMPQTKERVIEYLSRLGVRGNVCQSTDNCYKIRCKSRQLAVYLSQFKTAKTTINIPDFVNMGTIETRMNYIAGIHDADGSCKVTRKGRINLDVVCTIYPDFAKQVSDLVSSLGIPNKIRKTTVNKENCNDKYHVKVVGFRNKRDLAGNIVQLSNSEKIANDFNFHDEVVKEQNSYTLTKSLFRTSTVAKTKSKAVYKIAWENIRTEEDWIIPVTIESIEQGEVQECWDIQVENTECFVAEGILNHNSALISLSDLHDPLMRNAKMGQWWDAHSQRRLANNSFTDGKPDVGTFMKEWKAIYDSKSGERGIFNRDAAINAVKRIGEDRRDPNYKFGTNPCCLHPDTLVVTKIGDISLGEICESPDEDWQVLSYNVQRKEYEYVSIESAKLTREDAELYEIEIEDEESKIITLKLTPDHQVFTSNRGYVMVEDLTEEDDIVLGV